VRGFHAHLASGLEPEAMAGLARRVIEWALPRLTEDPEPEVNLGGGMAVDYADPERRFDWRRYAELLGPPPPGVRLRIEPGRALTAYCGWYVTDVLDIKTTRSERYATLRGGTHHLRTPVTKGHDQPFAVLSERTGSPGQITLVGQLCTPKDVFAREVEVTGLRIGDRVAFAMAGAYAWNISHHDFLMHPKPEFHYVAR
jgi:diaminopimelate decarboxylase